jgi:MFS family permease
MQWLLGDDTKLVEVNSRMSIIAIVYIAVIAPCVFILQPGYVQGLVEHLRFSEAQAGYIASAEMFGIAFTTILLIFIESRFDWRKLTMVFLIVASIGNLMSLSLVDFNSLAAVRFLTGMGSGGLMSITFAMMGTSEKSDRNFGYIITWVLTYGALGILAMPSAFEIIGMNGVLLFFALFNISGLFFLRYLPRSGVQHLDLSLPEDSSFSWQLKGLTLLAILAYNTSIGIVWAYMFLLGLEAGVAEQTVANVLTVSQFLGIAGAFLVVVLQLRIGRIIPLQLSIFGTAIGIYMLVGEIALFQFALGVCLFNFLWNVSMPYLLATMSDFDRRGRVVIYGIAAQTMGYAIGPFIAATLLGASGYAMVYTVATILFIASGLLLLPGLIAQKKYQ